MKPSSSLYVDVRGLRYHCRVWGEADWPKLFMLHGWMDVSASFQFLVDALHGNWRVVAPDWRGYGLSEWGSTDCYWNADYVGDLDRLLAHFEPEQPVRLIGHSLGGSIACLYAGVRPQRVARLVNLEGYGGGLRAKASDAPERYAKWLDQLGDSSGFRDYADFSELAQRMRATDARLTDARAAFLAQHWGMQNAGGRVELRSDPAHRLLNPVPPRADETMACWRNISAPVLWIDGAESKSRQRAGVTDAEQESLKGCFRQLSVHTVAQAGHMLHHDQPERLAELIEPFLR